jgi:hypothetical protein
MPDPQRGNRPARGRPLHDHADPRGRPPRRPGGAGYLQAWGATEPARRRAGAARAQVARLGEAVKELAVKLTLVEGKRRWG